LYFVSAYTGTGVSVSIVTCPSTAQFQQPITSWSIWWMDGSQYLTVAMDANSVGATYNDF